MAIQVNNGSIWTGDGQPGLPPGPATMIVTAL